MRIWLVISVFVYLLLWRPLVLGSGVPPTVVLVPLAVGLAQGSRYISVWRSDTSGPPRGTPALLLSPVATLWSAPIPASPAGLGDGHQRQDGVEHLPAGRGTSR